jgi:hypothetical protein
METRSYCDNKIVKSYILRHSSFSGMLVGVYTLIIMFFFLTWLMEFHGWVMVDWDLYILTQLFFVL